MAGLLAQNKDTFLQKLSLTAAEATLKDFKVISCSNEYMVDKLVLRLHSKYFDRLFKSDFIEAKENWIVLKEDPDFAIQHMIEYFYHFRYEFHEGEVSAVVPDDRTAIDEIASSDVSQPADSKPYSELEAHAHVYTVADKYDVPGLKELAKENFLREALAHVRESRIYGFLRVVPYVYANCPPGETELRSCIVQAWNSDAQVVTDCFGDQNLRQLVERFPDLGVDLYSGIVSVGTGNSRHIIQGGGGARGAPGHRGRLVSLRGSNGSMPDPNKTVMDMDALRRLSRGGGIGSISRGRGRGI